VLSLESPRWAELTHAYGAASDIPALLAQLQNVPSSENASEPWFSLWSALAHQGDVYSASFAAVPHIVHALGSAPTKADHSYFQFPAWVEICRTKNQTKIPEDLQAYYAESLAKLPSLMAAACEPLSVRRPPRDGRPSPPCEDAAANERRRFGSAPAGAGEMHCGWHSWARSVVRRPPLDGRPVTALAVNWWKSTQ
jgi:hypothetical protein